jgi:hypothetical protein
MPGTTRAFTPVFDRLWPGMTTKITGAKLGAPHL